MPLVPVPSSLIREAAVTRGRDTAVNEAFLVNKKKVDLTLEMQICYSMSSMKEHEKLTKEKMMMMVLMRIL